MATDPFSFILGQLEAAAVKEIDEAAQRRAQRILEVKNSMAGFTWLKDWRIAHPEQYLYAKKHKIDYSNLKRITRAQIERAKSDDQKARERANMRALKSTIYGDKGEVAFVPTVWKTEQQIFVIAKEQKLLGLNYAQFCQKYPGAYSKLQREGKINRLRNLFKLDPYLSWTKDSAIKCAQRYQSVSQFRKRHPGAYRALLKNPKVLANLFKDFEPSQRWTIKTALREVDICSANGFVLEDFRQKRSGCLQFLIRHGYLEEIRPKFDKNKGKWNIKDALDCARDIADLGGNRAQMKRERRGAYQYLVDNQLLHLLNPIFSKGRKRYKGYAAQLVLNTTS